MPDISVKFNGSEAHDFELQFLRGEIYERMYEHTRFNLVFKLVYGDKELIKWYKERLNKILGSTVEVFFSDSLSYKGKIVKFNSSKANNNTESQIQFSCMSDSVEFDSIIGSDCFVEKSLKEIFSGCSNKKVNVDDNRKYTVFRYNETGFNLIKRLAHEHGFWLFLKDNQWQCKEKLPDSKIIEPNGEVFLFGININRGFNSVKTNIYDTEKNELTEKSNSANDSSNPFWASTVKSIVDPSQLSKLAHSKQTVNEQNQQSYTEVISNRLNANLLFFNGESSYCAFQLGDVFSFNSFGNYRILEVSHFFTATTYHNSFTSIPDDHKMTPSSFTTDFIKPRVPVSGGVVTEIGKGKNTGLVKVQYDAVNGVSPFIKVLSTGAGSNRGIYFLPEKDDRVTVGFTDGHPDMPFIMSSHYDGKNKPELDGNVIKRIKTQTDLIVSFNDDKNKNEIIISTKDGQNKIAISHTDNKITVESKNGEVTVTGKTINIKANDAIKMEATNITMEAKSKIEISGAQTEIKGDAQTVIKGGIIKLN